MDAWDRFSQLPSAVDHLSGSFSRTCAVMSIDQGRYCLRGEEAPLWFDVVETKAHHPCMGCPDFHLNIGVHNNLVVSMKV
jgi:hypothetical protein